MRRIDQEGWSRFSDVVPFCPAGQWCVQAVGSVYHRELLLDSRACLTGFALIGLVVVEPKKADKWDNRVDKSHN